MTIKISKTLSKIISKSRLNEYIKYIKEDIPIIDEIIKDNYLNINNPTIIDILTKSNVLDIKNLLYKELIKQIDNESTPLNISNYPKQFIEENKSYFLIDSNIPDSIKEKYYNRELTILDILTYYSYFKDINIDYYTSYTNAKNYDNFKYLLKKYDLLFKTLYSNNELNKIDIFYNHILHFEIKTNSNLIITEEVLIEIIKRLYESNIIDEYLIQELGFNIIKRVTSKEDILNSNNKTIFENDNDKEFINTLGLDNLKRLNKESSIFEINNKQFKEFFFILSNIPLLSGFKDKPLPYNEFEVLFARYLNKLRKNSEFMHINYCHIKDPFRTKYQDLFLDDVPKGISDAFYRGALTLRTLCVRPDIHKYFYDKNIYNIVDTNINIEIIKENGEIVTLNFVEEYSKRFGTKAMLKLLEDYSTLCIGLTLKALESKLITEEDWNIALTNAIYFDRIKSQHQKEYDHLEKVETFKKRYPEAFLSMEELDKLDIPMNVKKELIKSFYTEGILYKRIKEYPELVDILKYKNLYIAFNPSQTYKKILDAIGNENYLKLVVKYGRYFGLIGKSLEIIQSKNHPIIKSLEDLENQIELIIYLSIKSGDISLNDEDAPSYLFEQYPEIFLSKDAPEELKDIYYYKHNNRHSSDNLTFTYLSNHKEYKKYITKDIILISYADQSLLQEIKEYINLFPNNWLELGIKYGKIIDNMIETNNLNLLNEWYKLTDNKYIPHQVIMKKFSTSEYPKYANNIKKWTKLINLNNYDDEESIDGLLKISYIFGVFESNTEGFSKLYHLLTYIPKSLDKDTITKLSKTIDSLNHNQITTDNDLYIIKLYLNAISSIKDIKLIDNNIIKTIYKKDNNDTYTLTINPQNNKELTYIIRLLLEEYTDLPLLTPKLVHQLFSGLDLTYDESFRNFIYDNLEEILKIENTSYLNSIQKQFKEIKTFNSNRKLTLDLAISYIQTNRYTDTLGNEELARVCGIAGYLEYTYKELIEIYKYTKLRTYNSIPRIKNTYLEFTYEILHMNDPLAACIGTLTNCCQELGNLAESCVVYSMIDPNSRIFIIRDNEGNIISQSWTWRNNNVLCFDNIEVPTKVFERYKKKKRNISNIIYEIYKKAALELLKLDTETYHKLYLDNKIDEYTFKSSILTKITVGLGYNDIAKEIELHSNIDIERKYPLTLIDFPLDLSRYNKSLYTNDSRTQYILEESTNIDELGNREELNIDTLPIYHDDYEIYDNTTFKEEHLKTLLNLEYATIKYSNIPPIIDYNNIVNRISDYYNSNPSNTKILLNPNVAIIFENNPDYIEIIDIFFNIYDSIVLEQIQLALDQINTKKLTHREYLLENQLTILNEYLNKKVLTKKQ